MASLLLAARRHKGTVKLWHNPLLPPAHESKRQRANHICVNYLDRPARPNPATTLASPAATTSPNTATGPHPPPAATGSPPTAAAVRASYPAVFSVAESFSPSLYHRASEGQSQSPSRGQIFRASSNMHEVP